MPVERSFPACQPFSVCIFQPGALRLPKFIHMYPIGYDVLACPYCSAYYIDMKAGSMNNLDCRHYSDGYFEGTMFYFRPLLVRCVNTTCKKCFRTADALKVDEVRFHDRPKEAKWHGSCALDEYEMSYADVQEVLKTDFCLSAENEFDVRTLLLQRQNKLIREDRKLYKSPKFLLEKLENINRLIDLSIAHSSPDQLLYKAELYREKGDFEISIQTLNVIHTECDVLKLEMDKVYTYARTGNSKVVDLFKSIIRKEYQCDRCRRSIFPVDHEKMEWEDHGYFRRRLRKSIYSAPRTVRRPLPERCTVLWILIFICGEPLNVLVHLVLFAYRYCRGLFSAPFDPEKDKCINCRKGKYHLVKWGVG